MFVKKTRFNFFTLFAGFRDITSACAFPKFNVTTMPSRSLKAIIGLFGVSGVILGALGAHALKATLEAGSHFESWQTAVTYHLIHTVAALAVWMYLLASQKSSPRLTSAVVCWLGGILLFSGSLYVLSLGGPSWFGPLTPCGGVLLIAGWVCLLTASI